LVGHVTKEGSIAGPKVLEHMVDAVLTLEGERTGMWRILRTFKNRFGATDEVGVFKHSDIGMEDVLNPSGAFLEESQEGKPGSAIVAVMEGTRPVLIEVQVLAVRSYLPTPRRVTQGVNIKKAQLLAAVIEKQTKLRLSEQDVFVNVAGGLTVNEPGVDLGVALAMISSMKNKALPKNSVVIGEVGLLGEIRKVSYLEKRIVEAKKLGYKTIISPEKYRDLKDVVSKVFT
jgi:DNA repair protein RadA/Sms